MLMGRKYFILSIFISIFTLKILTLSIPIQAVTNEDSNRNALEPLRSYGISTKENRTNYTVPRLIGSSLIDHQTSPINPQSRNNSSDGINLKIQGPTGSGTSEDYVDLTSDVDSSSDLGNHDSFIDLQATDSIYDNMTEGKLFSNITLINAESFEGTWPPSGWNETGEWNKEKNQVYDGTSSADYDGSASNPSGYLTTPSMDCSGVGAIYVEFWWRDFALDDDDFELEYYDGSTWDNYQDMNQLSHSETEWNFYPEKITDSQYFVSNFQIRWSAKSVSPGESAFVDLVTVKKETAGSDIDYNLDLEVQFTGVYVSESITEKLCIMTGSFLGSENLNVTYWDENSWVLITPDLTASIWNNYTVSLTSPTFTIKFGGSSTSGDSTQDWWEIDSILLIVEGPEDVLGDDSGFVWLDSPDEVNLGVPSSSWVQQDLSDDSVPINATGVILAWIEDSNDDHHAVARGAQDTNDFMNGGSTYCELEAGTWRMQMVKLSEHKYIETWRENTSARLYVMGYTVGADPKFRRVASDLGSLTADSSWNKITVSGVDDNTTGVILFGQSTSNEDATILVRAVDSTDSMTSRKWEEYNCGVFFVKIDANDQFEYYITSGRSAKFFLIAEVKDSIDWLDVNRDDISAASTGWTTRDLDSYITVPYIASGVILQHESTGLVSDYKNIAREFNQTWTFPNYDVGDSRWLMGGSGIDSDNRIQIYAEREEQDIYIHAITLYNDKTPPIINSFGVDDPGDGHPTIWANVTDSFSAVTNVTLLIDGTTKSMSKNASDLWIYQPPSINFGDSLTYQIVNASDTFGNTLKEASSEDSPTFDKDTVSPNVDDWDFYTDEGPYGTFKANVTDSWGLIDTVIVNVTYHENMGDLSALWAIMQNTTSGYMNNTIVMIGGSINFVVKVNDTRGNTFTSSEYPGYAPNNVPIAENVTLSSDALSVVLPVTSNDTLYLRYDYFDLEDDGESGTEIRWYKWNSTDWVPQVAFNDKSNITSSNLVKDETWYATVKPRDGKEFGSLYASENITIQNSPPIVTNVIIYPSDPVTGNTLTAPYEWTDPDGDTEQGTLIRWYCDFRNVSGFLVLTNYENHTEIPSSATQKDYKFYYNITPYDGQDYGTFIVSSQITIGNTPPTLVVDINDYTTPEEVLTTEDLIANYTYFDADSEEKDTGSLQINWYIYSLGSWVLNYTNTLVIQNGNTSTSDLWRVEIRISDGDDYSNWTSSATISIGVPPNDPPEALMVNLTLSDPVAGGYLNVSYTYFDLNGDDEAATTFRWYRNGIYQPQFDGPSFKILSSAPLIKGDNWTVEVKPQDIYLDYGDWSANATIMIGNTAPELLSVEIYPSSNVFTSNTLLAIYEEFYDDVDDDPLIDISIVWKNGSKEVPSLYNLTEVDSSYTKKGETWSFVIRVYDGTEWSITNYTAAGIIIQNSPMSFENVTITGGMNTSDDIVIVDYTPIDIDGDELDLARTKINWTVERINIVINRVNGTWDLSNIYFEAGDYITVQITPHDGESLGETWVADRVYVIIGNAAPTIVRQPYIHGPNNSTTFYASNPIYVNYTAWDPDSGSLYTLEYDVNGLVSGAEYKWYRNGSLVDELTTFFVPISYLSRGDTWNVSVRPRDQWNDFGEWVTSLPIIINNSPPVITEFYEVNPETRSDMDLDLVFIYFDYDEDNITLSKTLILWYEDDTSIPGTENRTIIGFDLIGNQIHVRIRLSRNNFARGDNISVLVQSFDGINWGIQPNISSDIVIKNSLPILYDVKIQPNGLDLPAYSTDSLNVTWRFFDEDNDPVDSYLAFVFIQWYNKGIEQEMFENRTSIPTLNISKGDTWLVEVQVFDGFGYSLTNVSLPISILNSPPIITAVTIWSSSNNKTQTYADTSLVLNPIQDVNNTDPDQDPILWHYTIIYWFKNGIYQPEYDDIVEIPSIELSKGESWFVRIQITDDGETWSLNHSSQELFIVNKAPEVEIFELVGNEFPDFLVEDENISVSINLIEIDPGDFDLSFLSWYVNGSYQSQYDNLRLIPEDQTQPGQNWTVWIRPYDGFDNGSLASLSFFIESRPTIQEFSSKFYSESEGLYQFAVKAHDSLDNQIVDVRFEVFLNGSTLPIVNTITNFPNATGYWILPYELHDFVFLNTNATIKITVRTNVVYSDVFYIINEMSYNFTLLDKSPPRVVNAWFLKDDERDPTSLTFYAEVEDFGLNISEVVLYYYFVPVSETEDTAGLGAAVLQTELHSTMIFQNKSDNIFLYSVKVDFQHEQSDTDIHYRISTKDADGNINEYAFDNTGLPDQTFIFQPPGLPEWVLLVAGSIVVVIFVGSIVYIKFIRKPELVGLDKELVLEKITEISEAEIMDSLDIHTLGVVVSFFDQRHGPIPIITIPEILKDNYSKLVELSDRSFSGTGFTNDFDEEIPSSYDLVLAHGLKMSVMSFGFALERPEARGGQENLTFNVLIHKEVFPLLSQFQDEIQTKVHNTHVLMNKHRSEQDKIRTSVLGVRKFVSAIVLSYQNIYGTTELLSEEE